MVSQTGPFPRGAQDVRLDDLFALRARLTARCTICGHEAAIDALQLLERYPHYTRIKVVEDKHRCATCKKKGFSGNCDIVIVWDPAVAAALSALPIDLATARRRRSP